MFVILGLCILLAAMLLINSMASLAVSLLWRGFGSRVQSWSAASRARLIVALRLLPVASGVVLVGLLFAPAYLAHEPRTNHETVSVKLAIVAAFSAVGIALALLRGLMGWRVTTRLRRDWLRNARPLRLAGIDIPTYQVDHKFPVIAIVGTLQPRLFVATRVLQSLTAAELAAAINHEAGHLVHRDNLKRGLTRACRDSLLIIPTGRLLDAAWKEASEQAADEHAAHNGAGAALELASSMVKIARMIPMGTHAAMPAGSFLTGAEDGGEVTNRVQRLLSLAQPGDYSNASGRSGWLISLPVFLILLIAYVAATEPHVLATTHSVIESVVYILK